MSDLEVNQTLLNIPGGASCKVGLQVSNIVLKNRTVLEKLQLVKSVTPLEVVHKELPEADLSESTEPELIQVNDSDLEAFDPWLSSTKGGRGRPPEAVCPPENFCPP